MAVGAATGGLLKVLDSVGVRPGKTMRPTCATGFATLPLLIGPQVARLPEHGSRLSSRARTAAKAHCSRVGFVRPATVQFGSAVDIDSVVSRTTIRSVGVLAPLLGIAVAVAVVVNDLMPSIRAKKEFTEACCVTEMALIACEPPGGTRHGTPTVVRHLNPTVIETFVRFWLAFNPPATALHLVASVVAVAVVVLGMS